MAEVKIKHKAFVYREETDDPLDPNKKVYVERVARRDEVLETDDLVDADKRRGELHGAFYEPEETTEEEVPVRDLSDLEMVAWIQNEQPKVDDVVAAADDDPVVAQRLLDAESTATGGEPRSGVTRGLGRIIA